jgi:hypothetical protein
MAKISARGAKEVCRVKARLRGRPLEFTFVLRSDRVILRKAPYDNGYKVFRKLATTVPATQEGLASILGPLGYEVA